MLTQTLAHTLEDLGSHHVRVFGIGLDDTVKEVRCNRRHHRLVDWLAPVPQASARMSGLDVDANQLVNHTAYCGFAP